jgi:large subunit ribosomal protein L32e
MTEKKPQLQRKALRTRERARNKKPAFLRPESWRDAKFSESWRRPRGLDNKVRQKVKGWPAAPSTGYKGPKIARGLHPSGYREVIVYNTEEVATVDSSTHAIRIAHTVGKRKRALILAEAEKLQIKVLNAPFDEEATEDEAEQETEETSENSDEKEEKTDKTKDKSKEKKK